MKNKKAEIGLIIIIICYLIFKYGGYLIVPLFNGVLTVDELTFVNSTGKLLGTIDLFIKHGFDLIIAIYLFIVAKKDRSSGIIWFSIGAVFGLVGLILYYLIDIRNQLQKKEIT